MSRNIAILVGTKGRGSNMANIVRACQDGRCCGTVVTVVSPSESAPAVEVARGLGARVDVLDPLESAFSVRLSHLFDLLDVDLVCLAGFLRLLPGSTVRKHAGKIINIHPALLPKHGGKGMYGQRVHAAVLAAGETVSGCSVHHVTEQYDEGSVILQASCPVLPGDTAESLSARVLQLEHATYVTAINRLLGCE